MSVASAATVAAGRRSCAPWQDWREWQHVHAALFSDDPGELQRALSRVAAWRSRAQLPVAVSATAQLLELQLHERLARGHHHGVGGASRSHLELSLQYASAVVRCVNGLVDSSQKGAYALAVSSLAQRIGIPLWIVDLRHESTHNQLPSLPVLRFAAQHLLAWLRANYWLKQDELLRMQVRRVGDALSARIAQLLSTETTKPSERATSLAEVLDSDKVRNIVVPLLVNGAQYCEHVAPTGLLFALPEPAETAATQTRAEEVLAKYPRDAFVSLLLEVQSVWRSFGAWLLAHLCRKVFSLNAVEAAESQEGGGSGADAGERLRETELCLLWIKFLISNDWREKLRFVAEPVDDIYHAGAEMLCHSEELKPKSKKTSSPQRRAVFERLQSLLRSCKGIRTHALLATDAALRGALNNKTGWLEIQEWTATPLGMRFTYSEMDSELEYSLDGDGMNAVAFALEEEDKDSDEEMVAASEEDEDARIDAVMAELDAAYDEKLEQARTLKDAVVEEVIREGQSVHQKLLPQQELQRIQSEIEIW